MFIFAMIGKLIQMLDRFGGRETDLERYIIAHNPVCGGDVDNLIRQYTYNQKDTLL